MKLPLLILATACFLASAFHGGRAYEQAVHRSSWQPTPMEKLAHEGIDGRVGQLDQEVALVASGNQALHNRIIRVALLLREIDADAAKVEREASARIGVAVVRSTSTWVPR